MRQGRHQEGARRLHHEPDRLHDAGGRPRSGRLRVRDLPPACPRVLQGQHVPRRRLGDARHGRRRGHAPLRRAAQGHAGHVPDLRDGLPRDHRLPRLLRLLVQGQDHRDRAGPELAGRRARHPGRRHHRLLHDPADAADVLHRGAVGARGAPARVAEGDDDPADRPRGAVRARRRDADRRLDPGLPGPGGRHPAGGERAAPGAGDHRDRAGRGGGRGRAGLGLRRQPGRAPDRPGAGLLGHPGRAQRPLRRRDQRRARGRPRPPYRRRAGGLRPLRRRRCPHRGPGGRRRGRRPGAPRAERLRPLLRPVPARRRAARRPCPPGGESRA